MNSTILNYPGFQDLPKSIRQMLVMSEEYFFRDSQPKPSECFRVILATFLPRRNQARGWVSDAEPDPQYSKEQAA